ncbi:DUF222 domain-containing protein, partial [Mycobacterium tuberculosis]|uniref:DUF222 domain-containing protein n=1 Tax=Mycobacterium tuberculosis TaxID=1773 RepID=UPI002351D5A1
MYSSSREEAVAAFDNLDTALNRVLKVSPDDLTIPECLAMLQRCEKIRRRLPAAEHPFINKLADQTDQTELGGKLPFALAERLHISRGEASRRIHEAADPHPPYRCPNRLAACRPTGFPPHRPPVARRY